MKITEIPNNQIDSSISLLLSDSGVDASRISDILNLPIGDSNIAPTARQIRARANFALEEAALKKLWDKIENITFPFFMSKRKRSAISEGLINDVSESLAKLNSCYITVLVAEQTEEWNTYRGNIYSNYYQYVEDGPKEIPSLYEHESLRNWQNKVKSLTN
jgi:hypothetical protein